MGRVVPARVLEVRPMADCAILGQLGHGCGIVGLPDREGQLGDMVGATDRAEAEKGESDRWDRGGAVGRCKRGRGWGGRAAMARQSYAGTSSQLAMPDLAYSVVPRVSLIGTA